MGGNHRAGLLQMHASIYAGEKYGIHFGEERCDIGHNLDAPLRANLFGKLIDARNAAFDIFAAAFVGSHHARAGDVILSCRVAVEELGERRDVGGIRADYAETDIGGNRELRGEEKRES